MTRRHFPSFGAALLTLAAASVLLPVPAAFGQFDLPEAITSAPTIGPEQIEQIRTHVQPAIERLGSGDPQQVKAGRNALLQPLTRNSSVPFRLRYSEVLAPELARLAQDERELTVVNALRVAGELGTDAGADLLERYRTDQRPAVRYAAVAGLMRTLAAIEAGNPAISSDRVRPIITTLGRQLVEEQHPHVLDVVVRALIEATNLSRQGFDANRGVAVSALATGASERLRAMATGEVRPELLPPLLRAGQGVRDVMTNQSRPLDATRDAAIIQAAGELGGDMMAFVYRRYEAGDYPLPGEVPEVEAVELRMVPAQLLNVGEVNAFLAVTRKDPRSDAQSKTLDASFRQPDNRSDARFLEDTVSWIGPQGELVGEFGLPPTRFIEAPRRRGPG